MSSTRASRPTPANAGTQPRALGAALLASSLLFLPGCPPIQDRLARRDVESLQSNVQQMETSLQSRQAGVTEQVRDLRESQARLENLLEENRRLLKENEKRVSLLREGMQEDFAKRDRAAKEAAQSASGQTARLAERLDTLQQALQTVNDNLVAMSTFEKKQEERGAKTQEQIQSQFRVIVNEVGKENQALTKSVAAVRSDLEAARQDAGSTRQGLVDLQKAMQQIADQVAGIQAQLQDLSRKQEAQRRSAAARQAGEHVVKAGETVSSIAARYGVSVKAILEKNRLPEAKGLKEGQKLLIPER